MRALVVFESMFGNTRRIAEAIAEGLASGMAVEVAEVGGAPTAVGEDFDVLVVGGPTHAFGMSRPATRSDAARQAAGPLVSRGIGLREWLAGLQKGSVRVAAAAFDTRIDKPRLPGSAARGADKRLRRLGFRVVAPPESFYVTGTPGPTVAGEIERARRWGARLGAALTQGRREVGPS